MIQIGQDFRNLMGGERGASSHARCRRGLGKRAKVVTDGWKASIQGDQRLQAKIYISNGE
jgi:hypothetical protein